MTPHERFERLYLAEADGVRRYCRYRVGPALADDVVAETFAVAWQKLDRVPTHARPWLLATARRISANQIRALRRRLTTQVQLSELDDATPSGDDDVVRRHDLIAALRRLPPADREAVLLVTWHDLTHAEAAAVMDCSVTAFGVRLHRARRRLQRMLTIQDADTHDVIDPTDPQEALR